MKKALFVVLTLLVLLSACSPKVGEIALIKHNETRVVEDWNYSASIEKPIACILNTGDEVKVLEFDTLILGSSLKETVVLIEHKECVGWVFANDIKKK
jgi:hypothetical protein